MTHQDDNSDALTPNPTARASGQAADEVTKLAHELSSLLDGSIRWLTLADRNLSKTETDPVEQARQQLDTVRTALVRMADLVNVALQSRHLSLGSPILGRALGTSLADAIAHAVEVLRPRADEFGIELRIDLQAAFGTIPCGALYSVVLNGLCNAIDSIEQAQASRPGGVIRVVGTVGDVLTDRRRQIEIEIQDDGVGVPAVVTPRQVFEPGYSTKPGLRGVGLAVCRSVIEELGGTIALTGQPDSTDPHRPGAVFRISCPEPDNGDTSIGGDA